MRPRRHIAPVLLVALLAVCAWWLMSQRATPAAAVSASAASVGALSASGPSTVPLAPAPSDRLAVQLPKAAPVENRRQAATAASAPASPAAEAQTNAQADLNSAISSIAELLRTGDYVAFLQNYTSPAELAAMSPAELHSRRQLDHNAAMQPMLNTVADALDSLKGQTPVFSDDGTRATFTVAQPHADDPQNLGPQPMVFVKVNGQWYKEPTMMINVDGQWYLAHPATPN